MSSKAVVLYKLRLEQCLYLQPSFQVLGSERSCLQIYKVESNLTSNFCMPSQTCESDHTLYELKKFLRTLNMS